MIKNILLICLLSTVGLGCVNNRNRFDLNGPDDSFTGIVNVRPIIATKGGHSQWDTARIMEDTKYVNIVYESIGLSFNFLPALKMEHPALFAPTLVEVELNMSAISMRRSREQNELVIWFIDSFDNFREGVAGMANMPQNLEGRFQHGIFVAANINTVVGVAHEIGHNFGLDHAWKDSLTDTPTRDSKDCVTNPCNYMAYCFSKSRPIGVCVNKSFSPQQIEIVRGFARIAPRSEVVTTRHKDLNTNRVITSRGKGPAVCDP